MIRFSLGVSVSQNAITNLINGICVSQVKISSVSKCLKAKYFYLYNFYAKLFLIYIAIKKSYKYPELRVTFI